jgi:hypothetical protein
LLGSGEFLQHQPHIAMQITFQLSTIPLAQA